MDFKSLDKEYYKQIEKAYGNELKKVIARAESVFKHQIILQSSSENLLLKYDVNTIKDTVAILGLVSIHNKFLREDKLDFLKWVQDLVDIMEQGNKVMTSANELSKNLIKRIADECEKRKRKLISEKVGCFIFNNTEWNNIILRIK